MSGGGGKKKKNTNPFANPFAGGSSFQDATSVNPLLNPFAPANTVARSQGKNDPFRTPTLPGMDTGQKALAPGQTSKPKIDNSKNLIKAISGSQDIDEITKAELISKARNKKTFGSAKNLFGQAQAGTNATYNDRFRLQTTTELLKDRPGRAGLIGF